MSWLSDKVAFSCLKHLGCESSSLQSFFPAKEIPCHVWPKQMLVWSHPDNSRIGMGLDRLPLYFRPVRDCHNCMKIRIHCITNVRRLCIMLVFFSSWQSLQDIGLHFASLGFHMQETEVLPRSKPWATFLDLLFEPRLQSIKKLPCRQPSLITQFGQPVWWRRQAVSTSLTQTSCQVLVALTTLLSPESLSLELPTRHFTKRKHLFWCRLTFLAPLCEQ